MVPLVKPASKTQNEEEPKFLHSGRHFFTC